MKDKYADNPILKYRYSLVNDPIDAHDIWHTTFGGVPAVQAWEDFMLWERFLNLTDAIKLWEIGTFIGGFSLYLATQCKMRGMSFLTVDFQRYWDDTDTPHTQLGTNSHFLNMDVFTPEFKGLLTGAIHSYPRPMILFCDGGNKPLEMQTFTPLMRRGDFLVTHDWGNEIADGDLVSVADLLEPVMAEECDKLHSLTRFFKRK